MPLSFLAPLFLAGLAAIAVPILVHLVQREKREPIAFPSLMFLERIPYRSSSRQRIRHWTLFALRCLVLALLAAAFARPFLDRRVANAASVGSRARDVVILLDRSYSMRYQGRWDRALAAARAEVDGLGPADRATLVVFDATARAATEPTGDRAALRASLGAVAPGDGVTRIEPAIKLAARLFDKSTLPRREAVLISDFQRGGWTGGEGAHLPPGAALRPVDVSRGERADLAVTGVDARRAREGSRETAALAVRVANRGTAPVTRAVHLEVGGREVERRDVRVGGGATATVELSPVPIPEAGARVTARLDADELPSDDAFHLVLARARDLPVLILRSSEAPSNATLYLARALAIGASPAFRVTTKTSDAFSSADLAERPLVIVSDAAVPTGQRGSRLAAYVRGGGGLVVALGGHAGQHAASELLPSIGAPTDRAGEMGGVLGYVERAHPVFELFRQPRSGDFSQARFLRYASVRAAEGDRELARFDDGATALVERRLGRGRVLVLASTLDGSWNDLPLQPVFLPFLHQLARYAAGWSERQAWRTVGDAADPAEVAQWNSDDAESGTAFVATTPSGKHVRAAPVDSAHRAALTLDEQGFYEIRRAGSPTETPAVVAANVDLAESELAHVEPQEIVRAVTMTGARPASAADETETVQERERRQSAWWYLLAALLVLLAAEAMLADRVTLRAAGRSAGAAD